MRLISRMRGRKAKIMVQLEHKFMQLVHMSYVYLAFVQGPRSFRNEREACKDICKQQIFSFKITFTVMPKLWRFFGLVGPHT